MGIGGISVWQLLIILAIVVMIFGTKKLRNLGTDLGGAIKGFKKGLNEEEAANENESAEGKAIEGTVSAEKVADTEKETIKEK